MQQNPDSDKQQKGYDFVHKNSPVLYWEMPLLSTPFSAGPSALCYHIEPEADFGLQLTLLKQSRLKESSSAGFLPIFEQAPEKSVATVSMTPPNTIFAVMKRAGAILAAAAAAAFCFNWLSPAGIPLVGQWDVAQGVITARGQEAFGGAETEIRSAEQAWTLFEQKQAVFVDARSESAFAEGRIPGAVLFPAHRFDEFVERFWELVPMDAEIVAYCSGRLCEDSHHLAGLLREMGYETVRVFIDGIAGWEQAGYPVERGGAREGS